MSDRGCGDHSRWNAEGAACDPCRGTGVARGEDEEEPELLASAYRRSLEVAAEHGLQSVSFPSISTGAFAFPIRLAAPIAVRTVIGFLREGAPAFDEVRFVLYVREDARALEVFAAALAVEVGESPAASSQ